MPLFKTFSLFILCRRAGNKLIPLRFGQVAPQDKLTDNVYHYDSQAKIFELGEKFVERQSERDNPDIEKEEKGSLLGDLKAKKDEVAKVPKK